MSNDQQTLALRLADQLGESGFAALQLAAAELRRIPELEAERDALRAEVEQLKQGRSDD